MQTLAKDPSIHPTLKFLPNPVTTHPHSERNESSETEWLILGLHVSEWQG